MNRACSYESTVDAVMIEIHQAYWENDAMEIVAENLPYSYHLENPDTGGRSLKNIRTGTVGKIVRLYDGRLAVLVHCSVRCDISRDADYWKRLRASDEVSDLILAARSLSHPVDTVLYDVQRLPSLMPGMATPAHKRKYTPDGRLYANQRETDETPEHYACRVREAVRCEPQRYFRREEIVRLEPDIIEHQRRLWITRNNVILEPWLPADTHAA